MAFLGNYTPLYTLPPSTLTIDQPIFSINSGTVSGNALTVGYPSQNITFRNAVLNNGTPISVYAAGDSLTIPSGATLGTVNNQQATIILLAIYTGGAVEPAVVNLAGGVDLSETGFISTTAISASATAANVVYSANARTNIPYRVIGAYYVTEATAGTWATEPSKTVGAGGNAFSTLMTAGYGQTWQDFTGSRTVGTTYYNSSAVPIHVNVRATWSSASSNSIVGIVSGLQVCLLQNTGQATYNGLTAAMIVPPGASYSINISGTINGLLWYELR